MPERTIAVDGNEAVARVAFAASEVIAIYPITPASPMGELADTWASQKRANLWGDTPAIIEMQSEAGAAGALHGALQGGGLGTTFTASQGLLLMIPNLFKIAGQLLPSVIHVAARSVATHALSIFCDHGDVMAMRSCGWAILSSSSVQEAQDMAAVAHAATLRTRVPFLHFMDGFRTSHEVNNIVEIERDTLESLMDTQALSELRARRLRPEAPVLRGSAQNPDVFFQAREAVNSYYDAVPDAVRAVMSELGEATGRRYGLFDYHGHPEADRVAVIMGSGASAMRAAVDRLNDRGEKTGVVQVRLYRPFDRAAFEEALPRTAQRVAVLDRTKEPGSLGEPLYLDVAASLRQTRGNNGPEIVGGRFGLGSKEFNPAMAEAVFHMLGGDELKHDFSIGIVDDVTHRSLPWEREVVVEPPVKTSAVFYGLGSDGTVGAAKQTCKIISEKTDLNAQGFFVYDSKKSGAMTISHLRIGEHPIDAAWLIGAADLVACHQWTFLERIDVLREARRGATFLLNAPFGPEAVWDHLPVEVQEQILERELRLFVIDAHAIAREQGLGGRINTVMQTAFFAVTQTIPLEEAIGHIKHGIEKSYGKRGASVLRRNYDAVDVATTAVHEVKIPGRADSKLHRRPVVPESAPSFVQKVTAVLMAGQGDLLPVSALPVDGTFPTATSRWERRGIAPEIPIWDPDLCVECGLCAIVCPHTAIQTKAYPTEALVDAPDDFLSRAWRAQEGFQLTVQVVPDDCTGCGMCVQICPARSKEQTRHKAIDMEPFAMHAAAERDRYEFFQTLPEIDRSTVRIDTVYGSQVLQPLFETSGACAGCGETPYLKLMTQLFGDRVVVANATGCSSIYGGNLPTTPWATNALGRGPAWANSLFEDNAEFGLGIRLSIDHLAGQARFLLEKLTDVIGHELVETTLSAPQQTEEDIAAQRERIAQIRAALHNTPSHAAKRLLDIVDALERKSVWIVGGDGWAYDIGFGGLDHVLASGRDVNVLVLDTEVYSNTGGQASKATPLGAIAKFASGGKEIGKKDLGMIAMAYGNVYVAQIAMGANPKQALHALLEAESYRGPSLILAYSHCIAHGIDMSQGMVHQKNAVKTGFWPLYRYDPRSHDGHGARMRLDSGRPNGKFRELAQSEARFAVLKRVNPQAADRLMAAAEQEIEDRWAYYKQMTGVQRETHQEENE